jgi:hypothetical protein
VNKEIRFKAGIDTSEFDVAMDKLLKKFDAAQRQQTTASRAGSQGFGGMLSSSSMEAFTKATKSSQRELEGLISTQLKAQEKISKELVHREERTKVLLEQQRQMNKNSQEYLDLQQKIDAREKTTNSMREGFRQRDQLLNKAMDARDAIRDQRTAADRARGLDVQNRMKQEAQKAQVESDRQAGFPDEIRERNQGGMDLAKRYFGQGMYKSAGKQIFSSLGGIGGVGGAMATVGALGEKGAEIYRDFSKSPVRTESSMGSAVSGTMGRQVGDIYGRRSAFEQMYAPERQRAAQQSLDTMNANRTADKWGTGFGVLKNVGAGVATGAAGGAALGALGMGVGAVPGAIAGGALGLGKGIWDIMGDERKRSMVMSPFSNTAKKRYGSILAEDMVSDYTKSYEGQKQQNPFKVAATNEYEQNWSRNLESQRSMGLNNEGFYGKNGFLNNNISQGFTPEMGLKMSGDILGAGGSTRMARDSAFGNQLARGTDLTNAGQVLGTLSGGIGGSEATKQATVKILAEGMKLGLDDSKFAEENRKFAQMTAEIVARSGAKGEGDFERVTGKFGAFVGENTNAGLGAAKGAYEQYQQISQTTTGPRGVMRAAGIMGDKDMNKMSTMTKQAVLQIPEEQLNEDHPVIQQAAKEAGLSPQEFVEKLKGVNQGAVSRFKEADTIRDRLKAGMKKMGKERLSEEDLKTLPEDMRSDFNKLATIQTTELGNQDQRMTTARALGTINPAEAAAGKQLGRENIIADKTTSIERTGRMEDTTVKAMAADSKVVLDNFNEMAPAMKKAAESTAAWTREVRENAAALQQVLEAARANKNADTLKSVEDLMKKMSGAQGNQQQTGPKSK